jgi:N-carbamoylputrescine amidase
LSLFRKKNGWCLSNSAYIIDTDGSEAGLYRKMHIPDDPHFYEKFYFTPGDLGFKTTHEKGKLEHLFVGINGILKRLD